MQPNLYQNQPEFIYSHDFDENGALYFLGSFGKTRLWQNPHDMQQVQAFASSIGAGRPADICGRTLGNTRTQNAAFSYFGVDLGQDRKLIPTCYTLRNRNSSSHVLLNWQFEGSNDKINWTCLDRRIYLTGYPEQDAQYKHIHQDLQKSGATSTWSIS